MHTVVSTAGCTSVYLSAERPLRLRHVHRHYPHALSTLAYTHSHTHACTHEHTALMRQGILSLRPQCPLVASPGMVAGPQLVTLWSPGHCQDLFCPPPRASCPQFLRSSQRALQNRAGQERSDAHQRTSPGVCPVPKSSTGTSRLCSESRLRGTCPVSSSFLSGFQKLKSLLDK